MNRDDIQIIGTMLFLFSVIALWAVTITWVSHTFGAPGFIILMLFVMIVGLVMMMISKED